MSTTTIIFGIILLLAAIFLIIAVLMQQGKSHNLSGTIAGGAETFFGKSKAQSINKKLSIITSVVAVIFVIIVAVFYATHTEDSYGGSITNYFKGEKVEATVDAPAAETTPATNAATDTAANTAAESAQG